MGSRASRRVPIGILGLVLGGLGVHRFALGDVAGGVLRLVISVVTFGFGCAIGFVEGFTYLTMSDEEFAQTYEVDKKAWF